MCKYRLICNHYTAEKKQVCRESDEFIRDACAAFREIEKLFEGE